MGITGERQIQIQNQGLDDHFSGIKVGAEDISSPSSRLTTARVSQPQNIGALAKATKRNQNLKPSASADKLIIHNQTAAFKALGLQRPNQNQSTAKFELKQDYRIKEEMKNKSESIMPKSSQKQRPRTSLNQGQRNVPQLKLSMIPKNNEYTQEAATNETASRNLFSGVKGSKTARP